MEKYKLVLASKFKQVMCITAESSGILSPPWERSVRLKNRWIKVTFTVTIRYISNFVYVNDWLWENAKTLADTD